MIHIIINPISCSGNGMKIWNRVESLFKDSGIEYQTFFTKDRGHATSIAFEITRITEDDYSEKTIVVLGGDGTLNEVINGVVMERQIKLGYIPTGSGNDFARSLRKTQKIKKTPEQIVKTIINSEQYQWIDYGVILLEGNSIETRRFAVSCGVGIDASICHEVLESKIKLFLNKYHLSKFSYLIIGIKKIIEMKTAEGTLKIDNGTNIPLNKINFISFHIHPFEGGGFCFAPKADYSDGLLNICVVTERKKLQMVPVFLKALFGKKICMRGVRTFQGKEVNLELKEAMSVHVDGESCGQQKNITVSCMDKRIRLIC